MRDKGCGVDTYLHKNSAQMNYLAYMPNYPSDLVWMGSSKLVTDYLFELLDFQEPIHVDLNL